MAKGSVRKKGKKWYYRFYIEDESGNRVQKEWTIVNKVDKQNYRRNDFSA